MKLAKHKESKQMQKLNKVIEGKPLLLVYDGKIDFEHLDKAKITTSELDAAVREHGVDEIKHVDLAVLEVDGNISILSHDFHRKTVARRRAHKSIVKNQ